MSSKEKKPKAIKSPSKESKDIGSAKSGAQKDKKDYKKRPHSDATPKKNFNHDSRAVKKVKPNFELVSLSNTISFILMHLSIVLSHYLVKVTSLKTDWNNIRVKAMTNEQRNQVMSKMAERIRGRILQITLRHDVSRVVQTILQFGSPTLRTFILTEISGKILEICKTQYGTQRL